MDIRSMLNGDASAKPARAAPARSTSMIMENPQSSPRPANINAPTRSMSLSTITEDFTPAPPPQQLTPSQPTSSLKRSSPSGASDDTQHDSKRARTTLESPVQQRLSESRSPIQQRLSETRSPVQQRRRERQPTPEYAKRMNTAGKKFSDIKADLRVQLRPHPNGRNGDHRRVTPTEVSLTTENKATHDARVSMEPNISGVPAYNVIQRVVMDMLFDNVVRRSGIPQANGIECKFEIEAKLGKVVDRHTRSRLALPVHTDTVLSPHALDTGFESALTKTQYARLNKYMNDLTTHSMRPGRSRIQYSHPKQVDKFYQLTRSGFEALPIEVRELQDPNHKPKLRVTTDATGAVKDRIVKIRVGDLEIYCPQNEFDIRISVNLECNYPSDCEAKGFAELDSNPEDSKPRDKDRLSYQHQATSIDLTLVKSPRGDETYEIEVELDADALLREGTKVMNNQENIYTELVGQLLENAFVLSRAAVDEANKPDASQVRRS